MISLREVATDDELEAWRQVRIAVLPNERTDSIEQLRRMATPEQLLLLAEVDGAVVGSGIAKHSDTGADNGFVQPRVVPGARRRGVGTALLRALAAHAESLGFRSVGSRVGDEGSLAFAARFGLRETGREVEQVRAIRPNEEDPRVPEGVQIVSLAERPDLRTRTYHELALQAFEDMPTPSPISITTELWELEWITWPEGSFVALAGDEIVGCAGLVRDDDHPDRAEHSLTAVRRDWRGRGLARALKETIFVWAGAHGVGEIYTWTQTGNENMRAVNDKLGFVTRSVSVSVRAPLPLRPLP